MLKFTLIALSLSALTSSPASAQFANQGWDNQYRQSGSVERVLCDVEKSARIIGGIANILRDRGGYNYGSYGDYECRQQRQQYHQYQENYPENWQPNQYRQQYQPNYSYQYQNNNRYYYPPSNIWNGYNSNQYQPPQTICIYLPNGRLTC